MPALSPQAPSFSSGVASSDFSSSEEEPSGLRQERDKPGSQGAPAICLSMALLSALLWAGIQLSAGVLWSASLSWLFLIIGGNTVACLTSDFKSFKS